MKSIKFTFGVIACLALSAGVYAKDTFPSQPVKLIVATSPGAGMDITTRLVADKLTTLWGQPVIVENRPGGSGAVAVNAFKGARGNVHTLLVTDIGVASIAPSLVKQPTYEPRVDFKPITDLFQTSFMFLVRPNRFNSLESLMAAARDKPGHLNYGSGGVASGQRLSVELFKSETGVELTYIPYRGNNEAIMALLSGDVDLVSIGLPLVHEYINNGKLKAVATTSEGRSKLLPDVPALAEFPKLKKYTANSWVGIFAPPQASDAIAQKIQADIVKVMQMPDVQNYYRTNDYDAGGKTPATFAAEVESDRIKYKKVIESAQISIQ